MATSKRYEVTVTAFDKLNTRTSDGRPESHETTIYSKQFNPGKPEEMLDLYDTLRRFAWRMRDLSPMETDRNKIGFYSFYHPETSVQVEGPIASVYTYFGTPAALRANRGERVPEIYVEPDIARSGDKDAGKTIPACYASEVEQLYIKAIAAWHTAHHARNELISRTDEIKRRYERYAEEAARAAKWFADDAPFEKCLSSKPEDIRKVQSAARSLYSELNSSVMGTTYNMSSPLNFVQNASVTLDEALREYREAVAQLAARNLSEFDTGPKPVEVAAPENEVMDEVY